MAKTKPTKSKRKTHDKSSFNRVSGKHSTPSAPPPSLEQLLVHATAALQQGDIDSAVSLAKQAISSVPGNTVRALPILTLLGEIHIELGDIDSAREYFLQAANIDSKGDIAEEDGGGAEKFLWLAQLSEEGGADSVGWFERGAECLRRQLQVLTNSGDVDDEVQEHIEEKRRKLSGALCGIVEVYMTDLSWEADAEQKCETLVTEATMVASGYAEPWQTLASVRLSQARLDDARAALSRSMDLWKDVPPEDKSVPDYPTRVSLARLLMDADLEEEAIEILERLVNEDDTSVEVWYLGGWALYIAGEKQKSSLGDETYKISWISSRRWLNESMRLYGIQDYEDIRLGDHAKELVALLDTDLGGLVAEIEGDEEDWEDDEDNENDESEDDALMNGA